MSLFSHDDYSTEDQEVIGVAHVIPQFLLLETEEALQSGLDAAREAHENAIAKYGARMPTRVGWYAKEVERIEGVLARLRQEVPHLFPLPKD
jgi:hypothetical protein